MIFRLTPIEERQLFAATHFATDSEVQAFADINGGSFEAVSDA